MATQPLANTVTKVRLQGRRESIDKIHTALRTRTDKKVNQRTDKPFSVVGELENVEPVSGSDSVFTADVLVVRDQIRGNHKNDVNELFRNVTSKENVDVKFEIVEYSRTQTEQREKPVKAPAEPVEA
jgi:hypothetical protein